MFIALISVLLGAAASNATLSTMTIEEITNWLGAQEKADVTFDVRLHDTVQKAMGTAYAEGPLGEGPGAKHDPDPLVNLREVDCVTFVEQAVAFSAAPDFQSAVDLLQKIRYEDGKIGYETRNHFLVADWLKKNAAWCRDISRELGLPAEELTRTIDRAGFFRSIDAADVGQDLKPETITMYYVPSAQAAAAEKVMPDACMVTFLGKPEWLFALHCGMWLKDGDSGQLYHASSNSGKVASVDFSDYVAGQSNRYIGFLVHKLSAPK